MAMADAVIHYGRSLSHSTTAIVHEFVVWPFAHCGGGKDPVFLFILNPLTRLESDGFWSTYREIQGRKTQFSQRYVEASRGSSLFNTL